MENTIFIIRARFQRASHPVAVGTRAQRKHVILDPEQLENDRNIIFAKITCTVQEFVARDADAILNETRRARRRSKAFKV